MCQPKSLQPRPTAETESEPMRRVSVAGHGGGAASGVHPALPRGFPPRPRRKPGRGGSLGGTGAYGRASATPPFGSAPPVSPSARSAAFVLLLAASLVPGCTCASDSVNRGDLNLVSLDDEWALGRDLAAQVDAQVRPVPDPVVQDYLDRMGRAVADQTEMADREWTFTVIDDPAVNAFALPGGHVYVNAGLVAAADGPAELASVVAHEVAHGVARHSTERMVKAQGVGWVAGLVLGEDPGVVRQVAAELVGRGALARFSRGDEAEADRLGLEYLAEAGFDPGGQAAMFQTLVDLRGRRPQLFRRWFQSHPLGEDRVEAAETAARDLRPAPPSAAERTAFRDVQRRLRPFTSPAVR